MPDLYFLSIASRRHTLGRFGLALELRLNGGINELRKNGIGCLAEGTYSLLLNKGGLV